MYIISGWQWGVQEVSLVVHPLIGLAEWCPLAAMMNVTCLPPPTQDAIRLQNIARHAQLQYI
jgi:hypothetical protein